MYCSEQEYEWGQSNRSNTKLQDMLIKYNNYIANA